MLTVLGVCYGVYTLNKKQTVKDPLPVEQRKDILIPGIFSSHNADGLTPAHEAVQLMQRSDVPWVLYLIMYLGGTSRNARYPPIYWIPFIK